MKHLFILLICIIPISINAQYSYQDSTAQNMPNLDFKASFHLLKKSIVPISLIMSGVLISNSQFEKDLQKNVRNHVSNDFRLAVDDVFLVAPVIEMYIADALHTSAKNSWFDQTKYLFISNLLSSSVTLLLKISIDKPRPNEENSLSFPSGHTTVAFTNAAVLQAEFKETSPYLAYSGYAFAITTGAFRAINNKHWLSDVLAGAGIGILATEIVYYFEPFKDFNPFDKKKKISLLPNITNETYGMYFSYTF